MKRNKVRTRTLLAKQSALAMNHAGGALTAFVRTLLLAAAAAFHGLGDFFAYTDTLAASQLNESSGNTARTFDDRLIDLR